MKPTVAVMSFESLLDDRESDIWATGMTDAVITDLAKLGRLEVRPRSQILAYETHTTTVQEIGADLNVAAVLKGSIQKVGNQVRVSTQLVDAKTGNHLWAE